MDLIYTMKPAEYMWNSEADFTAELMDTFFKNLAISFTIQGFTISDRDVINKWTELSNTFLSLWEIKGKKNYPVNWIYYEDMKFVRSGVLPRLSV